MAAKLFLVFAATIGLSYAACDVDTDQSCNVDAETASSHADALLQHQKKKMAKRSDKPNVVVIIGDDMGWGDLKPPMGSNEDTVLRTPNIDAAAAAGVALDMYYVHSSCTPSRAALMTGRYPHRYGLQTMVVVDFKPYGLALDETMMSNVFKNAGYKTHAIGKWHLGFHEWGYTPTFRGFDSWWGICGGEGDHHNYTWWKSFLNLPAVGDLHYQEGENCGHDCHKVLSVGGDSNHEIGYSTVDFTNKAIEVIEAHDPVDPLFMYIAYTAPHSPCQTPPEGWTDDFSAVEDAQRRVYAEMVFGVDESIGQIMDALRTHSTGNMLDNTILLFTSDNGAPIANPTGQPKIGAIICQPYGHFGQDTGGTNYPLRGGKLSNYEGGVRGFAFVHWPAGLSGGRTYSATMHITDWLPTLATAADVPLGIEKPLDGSDHWAALSSEDSSVAAPVKDLLVYYDCVKSGGGGCVLRGRTKLCVGTYFKTYPQIQGPPEAGEHAGNELLPAPNTYWNCPNGCVVDLDDDPQERTPLPLTTDEHQSMKESYEALIADRADPLWDQFGFDRRAMQFFAQYKHTWPWADDPPPASATSLLQGKTVTAAKKQDKKAAEKAALEAVEKAKSIPTMDWDS